MVHMCTKAIFIIFFFEEDELERMSILVQYFVTSTTFLHGDE